MSFFFAFLFNVPVMSLCWIARMICVRNSLLSLVTNDGICKIFCCAVVNSRLEELIASSFLLILRLSSPFRNSAGPTYATDLS